MHRFSSLSKMILSITTAAAIVLTGAQIPVAAYGMPEDMPKSGDVLMSGDELLNEEVQETENVREQEPLGTSEDVQTENAADCVPEKENAADYVPENENAEKFARIMFQPSTYFMFDGTENSLHMCDIKSGESVGFYLVDADYAESFYGWNYITTPESLNEVLKNRFGEEASGDPDKVSYSILKGDNPESAEPVTDGSGPITVVKDGVCARFTKNDTFDRSDTSKYYFKITYDQGDYLVNTSFTMPIVMEPDVFCDTKEEAYAAVRNVIRQRINNNGFYHAGNPEKYHNYVYDRIYVKEDLFSVYPIYMTDVCDFEAERDGMQPYEGDYMYNLLGDSSSPAFYYEDPQSPKDNDAKGSCKKDGKEYRIYEIYLPLITTKAQEDAVDAKVAAILGSSDFLNAKNGTNARKIQAAYNYVRSHVSSATGDRTMPIKHTAYNALCNGSGTCEAYAQAFTRLTRELGVPSKVLMGLDANNHTYNIVLCDDGKYRFIDCSSGIYLTNYDKFSHAPLQDRYTSPKYRRNYTENIAGYSGPVTKDHKVTLNDEVVYQSTDLSEVRQFLVNPDNVDPDGKYTIVLGVDERIENDTSVFDTFYINGEYPQKLLSVDLDLNGHKLDLRSAGSICLNEIRNGELRVGKNENGNGYSGHWNAYVNSLKDLSITGLMLGDDVFEAEDPVTVSNVTVNKARFWVKKKMKLAGNLVINGCMARLSDYSIVKDENGDNLGKVTYKGTNTIGCIGFVEEGDNWQEAIFAQPPVKVTAEDKDGNPVKFTLGDVLAENLGTLKRYPEDFKPAVSARIEQLFDSAAILDAVNEGLTPDDDGYMILTVSGKKYMFAYPGQTDPMFTVDLSGAGHTVFSSSVASLAEDLGGGKYKYRLKKGTEKLKFTLETKSRYLPYFPDSCDPDSDPYAIYDVQNGEYLRAQKNRQGDAIIYEYEYDAAKYVKKTITIRDKYNDIRPVTFRTNDPGVENISVTADGMETPLYEKKISGSGTVYEFRLKPYQIFTVKIEPKPGYVINPAMQKVGSVSPVKLSPANEYSDVVLYRQMSFTDITAAPAPVVKFTEVDGDEDPDNDRVFYEKDKAGVKTGAYDKYKLQIVKGDSVLKITAASAYYDKKAIAGFAVVSEGEVLIDTQTGNRLGTKPVVLTVSADDGTVMSVNFSVTQAVTSVSLSGFKVDRITGKAKVSQPVGTEVSYRMTLNGGADPADITVGDGSEYAQITGSNAKNLFLTVRTYKEEGKTLLASSEIMITFMDKNGNKTGNVFTVEPTVPDIAAPAVKVVSTTDTYAALSVQTPKKSLGTKNLFCKVTAKAKGEAAEHMEAEPDPVIVNVKPEDKETVINLPLAKAGFGAGKGHAQKYDIEVFMYQVADDSVYVTDSPLVKGKVKTVSAATKEPCYETKLSLKKKTNTFTAGQKNVVPAYASFSKNTTYTEIEKAWITDGSGNVPERFSTDAADALLKISEDKQAVIITDSRNMAAGKYTLYVTPIHSAGTEAKPASVSLTVRERIDKIMLIVPTLQIYKPEKKAATVKIKAVCSGRGIKSASSKLDWEIVPADDGELPEALKEAVSVRNGTVTVRKDLILSNKLESNQFRVKAVAKDLAEDEGRAEAVSEKIFIKNICYNPERILIDVVEGTVKGKPVPVDAKILHGQKMNIYDDYGVPISLSDLTVTIAPKDGMTIDETGIVRVTKSGTYTVKVTTNDGGKRTLTAKFAVK